MTSYITKKDINSLGVFSDRKDNFDDDMEISAFIKFAKKFYKENYEIRSKPFGDYNVDIGIYRDNVLISTVDVERWRHWDEDWPNNYRYISFLGRKEKFLKRPEDFAMVYFNKSLDKLLVSTKKDIIKYPTQEKYFSRLKKSDLIRQIPFDCGRLYGKNLTDMEKQIFKNHYEGDYLND
jgi:hypothetical protein